MILVKMFWGYYCLICKVFSCLSLNFNWLDKIHLEHFSPPVFCLRHIFWVFCLEIPFVLGISLNFGQPWQIRQKAMPSPKCCHGLGSSSHLFLLSPLRPLLLCCLFCLWIPALNALFQAVPNNHRDSNRMLRMLGLLLFLIVDQGA